MLIKNVKMFLKSSYFTIEPTKVLLTNAKLRINEVRIPNRNVNRTFAQSVKYQPITTPQLTWVMCPSNSCRFFSVICYVQFICKLINKSFGNDICKFHFQYTVYIFHFTFCWKLFPVRCILDRDKYKHIIAPSSPILYAVGLITFMSAKNILVLGHSDININVL